MDVLGHILRSILSLEPEVILDLAVLCVLAEAAFVSVHLVHLILDLGSFLPHLLGELFVLLELFIIHVELLLLNLIGSVRELLNLLSSESVIHCILVNKDPVE